MRKSANLFMMVFFPDGKSDKGGVSIAVNGKEVTVEPRLDENALVALQDLFAKVDKGIV